MFMKMNRIKNKKNNVLIVRNLTRLEIFLRATYITFTKHILPESTICTHSIHIYYCLIKTYSQKTF